MTQNTTQNTRLAQINTAAYNDGAVNIMGHQLPDNLIGPRLTLRPLVMDDAPRFATFASDYDIARMTGSFPRHFPQIFAEFRILYMQSQKRRRLSFNYAVTQIGDNKIIGITDLFRPSEDDIFEIGYWIAKPFWNQNYATEACQIIIKAARERLGIKQLKAGVFSDNPASLRVLEKLGFEISGPSNTYFSMARMENAESINLMLNFKD